MLISETKIVFSRNTFRRERVPRACVITMRFDIDMVIRSRNRHIIWRDRSDKRYWATTQVRCNRIWRNLKRHWRGSTRIRGSRITAFRSRTLRLPDIRQRGKALYIETRDIDGVPRHVPIWFGGVSSEMWPDLCEKAGDGGCIFGSDVIYYCGNVGVILSPSRWLSSLKKSPSGHIYTKTAINLESLNAIPVSTAESTTVQFLTNDAPLAAKSCIAINKPRILLVVPVILLQIRVKCFSITLRARIICTPRYSASNLRPFVRILIVKRNQKLVFFGCPRSFLDRWRERM